MRQPDFKRERELMVKEQLISRGVKDPLVLNAFRKVPREKFVPLEQGDESYGDFPLPIGEEQTISQPYIVALMTEALRLKGEEKILEIGTGSGYQAAIIAEIVKEVYTIERIAILAQRAKKILKELSYQNIKIKIGDGTKGWKEFSPYDGIIVTAAAPRVPESLIKQLAKGGRLIIPIGDLYSQELILYEKKRGRLITANFGGCRFVPLKGEEGWK
ncbi:MAG: protein-L-isoaspartate(D-aspartate) O-methyltransferase [Candidatus Omnitrophica bacterium]|nr:protein-L-isoaspartate(D-aspartate) O-methyltransferase [Candidatus Omnitrophota bacterium]